MKIGKKNREILLFVSLLLFVTVAFGYSLKVMREDVVELRNNLIEQRRTTESTFLDCLNIFSVRFNEFSNRVNKVLKDSSEHAIMRSNAQMKLIRDLTYKVNTTPTFLLPKLAKQITPSIVKITVHAGFDEWTGREKKWSGSGVFIKENLILTAGHVVDIDEVTTHTDPEYLYKVGPTVEVELVDGTKLKVVNTYMESKRITDIGLVEVEWPKVLIPEKKLLKPKPLSFGVTKIGETVFAIGEPFGYFPSVTCGIVSALNVDIEDDFWGEANLLQTDCAINPGNSGCPLLNMKGEVVAIVVGAHGYVPQSSGIGFCVPADVCQKVIKKYLAVRTLERVE